MTLLGRTKHSQKICWQECLRPTPPTSTRLNGIEVTWLSASPHAVFTCVCGKRIETVAWSSHDIAHYYIPHWTLFTARRIRTNGTLFWWVKKSSCNIKNKFGSSFWHPALRQNGFLSLLLELEHAELDLVGRGGPGCLRSGVSRSSSSTFPTLQHVEWQKRRGGADSDLTCQSQYWRSPA